MAPKRGMQRDNLDTSEPYHPLGCLMTGFCRIFTSRYCSSNFWECNGRYNELGLRCCLRLKPSVARLMIRVL